MEKSVVMKPGPKHAYDMVCRQTYEEQRDERLTLDDLPQDRHILLRYSPNQENLPYYALDFIICVRGIYKARKSLHEVHFQAVKQDGKLSRTVGVAADDESLLVRTYPLVGFDRINAEIGYFISGPESINAAPEDFILDENPLEATADSGRLQLL